MPHMNSLQSTILPGTGINDICPWTYMPAMLHRNVPLHYYCSLHVNSISLHIQVWKNFMAISIYMLLPSIYQQQIWPSNVTYMLYVQISPSADMRHMPVYTSHMNSIQSTVLPGALVYIYFTLLQYAPEQICLPYCTCITHMSTLVYIWNQHYCPYQ